MSQQSGKVRLGMAALIGALALAVLGLARIGASSGAERIALDAGTVNESVLYSFCSQANCADGEQPNASLTQCGDGNFYGTTPTGGANVGIGDGTVFKLTPSGTLTTLHSFCSLSNCADGGLPEAGLIHDSDGNLYGTTSFGGAENGGGFAGTIFKLAPSGTLTTLYSFCSLSKCADGSAPSASLIQDSNGNFYGTTSDGGENDAGTVFKLTPAGTLTTLYSFCSLSNCADGSEPKAGLIQDSDGNFYGTTYIGGTGNEGGVGTVFKLTPSGTLTNLYSFCSQSNCADGSLPEAGLIQDSDGNLYGTTSTGGTGNKGGVGTIFKLTPSGTLTTLYSFCTQSTTCSDGSMPEAGLIQGSDRNFYGTTAFGGGGKFSIVGSPSGGTVFKLTPSGTLTTLYSFCSQSDCTDGAVPQAAVIEGSNGNFYGTTSGGGAIGSGTVFELSASPTATPTQTRTPTATPTRTPTPTPSASPTPPPVTKKPLKVSPKTLKFTAGGTGTQTVAVSNPARNGPAQATALTLSDPVHFTASGCVGQVLVAGGSPCEISVTYMAPAAGKKPQTNKATLEIDDTTRNGQTKVKLTGKVPKQK